MGKWEKQDYFMNISRIYKIILQAGKRLDASFISRLRGGKRQSAIDFLTAVIDHSKPPMLRFYSGQASDRMTTCREYSLEWASLMLQVLEKIITILTIDRDMDEILNENDTDFERIPDS